MTYKFELFFLIFQTTIFVQKKNIVQGVFPNYDFKEQLYQYSS